MGCEWPEYFKKRGLKMFEVESDYCIPSVVVLKQML